MNIVFDLDGTLICPKKRLYMLFCYVNEGANLTFLDYWGLKLSGKSNQDILKEEYSYSDSEIAKFMDKWMRLVEVDCYLEMDTIIGGVACFLEELSKANSLFVCTARQSRGQAIKQLTRLSVLHFFENVFVTEGSCTKTDLLKNSGIEFKSSDWIVGDTGHDIMTGKELCMNTCAVLSGVMTAEKLKKYSPDLILLDVTKINFL